MSKSESSAVDTVVESEVQVTLMTPYQAAKLINAALAAAGVVDTKKGGTKQIPPQMVYTYVRKGYIPSEFGRVAQSDVEEWLAGYLAKQSKAVADPEQHEFDLAEAH